MPLEVPQVGFSRLGAVLFEKVNDLFGGTFVPSVTREVDVSRV